METLLPFVGIIAILAVAVIALIQLKKHGIRLLDFSFGKKVYIRFQRSEKPSEVSAPNERIAIHRNQIDITKDAIEDCKRYGYDISTIYRTLEYEIKHHNKMFIVPIVTTPIALEDDKLLLISWDLLHLKVERILSRSEAYPKDNNWSQCLALYRRAAAQKYRQSESPILLEHGNMKATLRLFKLMVREFNTFIAAVGPQGSLGNDMYFLDASIEEAESCIDLSDFRSAIGRLEYILSTIHKLLLEYVPRNEFEDKESNVSRTTKTKQKRKRKILIVDDEPHLRLMYDVELKKQGYETSEASNACQGLELFDNDTYDCVVLDIRMAGMDGITALQLMLERDNIVPVILNTAFSSYRDNYLTWAADAYITKSSDVSELIDTVKQLVDDKEQRAEG